MRKVCSTELVIPPQFRPVAMLPASCSVLSPLAAPDSEFNYDLSCGLPWVAALHLLQLFLAPFFPNESHPSFILSSPIQLRTLFPLV